MPRIPMSKKEIDEARKNYLPENLISKFEQGIEPTDGEKIYLKKRLLLYVSAHKRDGEWVSPQIRKFTNRKRKYEATVLFGGYRFDKHVVEAGDKKSARKKVKNKYKKQYQRDVDITSLTIYG